MRNIIYQYWDGELTPGNIAGIEEMKSYAERIGVEYLFEYNPKFFNCYGQYSPHFGALKIFLSDQFKEYDNVLFCDTDVIPVKDLSINIFDQYSNYDLAIVEEWNQPEIRLQYPGQIDNKHDERWVSILEKEFGGFKYPRIYNDIYDKHLPRVFNSGVVLYSKTGIEKLKNTYDVLNKYIDLMNKYGMPSFYSSDQPYINFLLEYKHLNWITMDYRWNSSVHYTPGTIGDRRPITDLRNDSHFVHIQLRGADHFDKEKTLRIANLTVSEWNL